MKLDLTATSIGWLMELRCFALLQNMFDQPPIQNLMSHASWTLRTELNLLFGECATVE